MDIPDDNINNIPLTPMRVRNGGYIYILSLYVLKKPDFYQYGLAVLAE
jgi:hypothetical protein